MSWPSWKSFETEVAEKLGGTRRVRVLYSESCEDITHPTYSIECKYGKQIPKYCVVDEVMRYGDWLMVPSKLWGSGRYSLAPMRAKDDTFIKNGIEQAQRYNPEKIPMLCVKPVRYRGFIIILPYQHLQAASL